ncbi:MAG TPA: DUF3263 domain-containing protein [Natronosporangium sp.]|nr:DUF3263 domain-containing protein [Natronosporangium sp.]
MTSTAGEVGEPGGSPASPAASPPPESPPSEPSAEPTWDERPGEAPEEAASASPSLSEREAAILAFERQWWRRPGAKEQAIRDTFGLSPIRYYQLLNRLLDHPAAFAADPVLVGRLRRLRTTGRRPVSGDSTDRGLG